MAVQPAALAEGLCYVTSTGQVRHIISLGPNDLVYEARGKEPKEKPWGPKITVSITKFSQDVDREVPCHYAAD